jgi:hypothetical protein
MRTNWHGSLWLSISILGALSLSQALLGQASPRSEAAVPATTDWSQHQVIFSKPGTPEQIERVERDPRYWQQLARHAPARLPGAENSSAELRSGANASVTSKRKDNIKRDWSQDLGTGATVGAGNYPAKFSFSSTTADCVNDFVVYSTGLPGSGSQANIVAYNNLYSGCPGTVPSVYWAYNTSSTILTSPVFSKDGTQLAFVQTSAGVGTLALLKWAPSSSESVGSPLTPPHLTHPAYHTCVVPCFTTVGLSGNNDTTSSVFYDYTDDVAYVGDSAGRLHKFTTVFKGVIVQVASGGWPVQVSTGPTALTNPVYDSGSGNVFVEDQGGFLYAVDSTTAGVTQSGQLDFSVDLDGGGPGFVQGPIVDSTAGLVYAFAPSDGSGGCPIGVTVFDCAGVFQLSTGFLVGDTGSEAVVGASTVEPATPNPLYIGAFDSTYENSVNASGHLYVCGNTGGSPILYQVLIQAKTLGTVTPGPPLSTSTTTPCSPVTDVLNPNASGGATEWLFAGAQNGGASAACSAGGCIFNFKNTSWLPSTVYTVGQEVLDSNLHIEVVSVGGTSGATTPFWIITTGGVTTSGSVHWLNQGPLSAFTPAAWVATHRYSKGTEILDRNGNIQLVTTAGVSASTIPGFNATAGVTTRDNTVTWTNVGAIATAALSAAGGTSGIIMDNTVGSGTQVGASQIYFSTLGGQVCGTSGTGGCAVQASQSALQ